MKHIALIAIVISIALGQYFWLSDTNTAYQISLNFQLFIAWLFAFYLIPYKRLIEKSLVFIFALSYISDTLPLMLPYTSLVVAINTLIFAAWFIFAMFRNYGPIGDNIESTKIYWIAAKPKRTSSFFVSLFGSPVGGSSLLINNKIYGFHDGKFEERDFTDRLNIVAMDSGLKITQGLTDYLSLMKGRKWSWVNNCLTMRLRIQLCQKK